MKTAQWKLDSQRFLKALKFGYLLKKIMKIVRKGWSHTYKCNHISLNSSFWALPKDGMTVGSSFVEKYVLYCNLFAPFEETNARREMKKEYDGTFITELFWTFERYFLNVPTYTGCPIISLPNFNSGFFDQK